MAIGLAAGVAQSILNALCRNVAWTQPAGFFIKLHTADPGVAGATAAFGDATRQAATFSAAAADGTITTSADTNWTNVSAAGTVTSRQLLVGVDGRDVPWQSTTSRPRGHWRSATTSRSSPATSTSASPRSPPNTSTQGAAWRSPPSS